MNYKEFVDSGELSDAMGKNSIKWIAHFNEVVQKNNLEEVELGVDEQKWISSTNFSFMGLIFSVYWLAYHNGFLWLSLSIFFSLGNILEIYFNFPYNITSLGFSAAFALMGKNFILYGKIHQKKNNQELSKPSWKRVFISVIIVALPLVVAAVAAA